MLTRLQHEFIEHIILVESEGSKISDARWADTRKLDPSTVTNWRKAKEFESALEAARSQWKDKSPSDRRTHLWALDEAVINYDRCKTESERRHWWKVIYELTKPEDTGQCLNYAGHTDEELWALIESRGLTDEFERVRDVLGDVPCSISPVSSAEPLSVCVESGSDGKSLGVLKSGRPRKGQVALRD